MQFEVSMDLSFKSHKFLAYRWNFMEATIILQFFCRRSWNFVAALNIKTAVIQLNSKYSLLRIITYHAATKFLLRQLRYHNIVVVNTKFHVPVKTYWNLQNIFIIPNHSYSKILHVCSIITQTFQFREWNYVFAVRHRNQMLRSLTNKLIIPL